ncbi:MAG: type II toxin-antitoxin system RelE/ParE family toxin [Nitrospira sp. LK70]|nr:type II toxin-antitoxin system RelE/ParE family toxin [Nitrospira sp. LK70]
MARRLVVQRQSDLDIQAAALWYEDQRHGLGMRFLSELDEVLQRIESNPKQFPQLEGEVRRALLHHFPYGVYFVEGPDDVAVLAVLHLHRDPDMWKSRI